MKISEAIKQAKQDTSFVAIKILLSFHLKKSFEEIFLIQNEELENSKQFFNLIESFKNGIPLEYITNEACFNGEKFFVDERVLIPRDETEILLFEALKILKNIKNSKICEVGTGSGILAINLAKELQNAKIFATDLSAQALEVAKINANNFGVQSSINFVNCSYFDEIDEDFDLIISNPPYIQNSAKLDKNVLNEPHLALFGGEIGHEILENLIIKAKNRTKFLLCEIGFDQKEVLSKILSKNGFEAWFYKDLAGFDRGFVAKRMENESL